MTTESNQTEINNIPTHYIGIGASAGGLEAIDSFFANMPSDSGFAFIVIQHLSPDHKSLMVELLSKKTKMKVFRAEKGVVVQANSIYLIPPKKNLTISHGKLDLSDQDHTRGINLPIDMFLKSLAEDIKERAVGIILSGTGSDGMRGVRAIKEFGGMVMVQSEESAKFDGMPKSAISTGLVDFILKPEDMPDELLSFITNSYDENKPAPDTYITDEENLNRIFVILREKTKVDFTYYKPSTIVRRIERRMTINQIKYISDYVNFLETYPGESMSLYRELLIGVTSFFRNPEVFNKFYEEWLPEIVRKKQNGEVRIWIAGCSTGEEAYTIAVLVRECIEKLNIHPDVKIFATDLDRDAILSASNGLYPESIAADLTPKLLSKYFYRKDDSFQVSRKIREMVVFAHHNLVKDPPFTNIDIISCRNLLIYLQPILQHKALEMFNFSLNENGILILGTSETVGDMSEYFEPLHHKSKIFRSKGKVLHQNHTNDLIISRVKQPLPSTRKYLPSSGRSFIDDERMLERYFKVLSDSFVPFSIIVNDKMEVVHTIGDSTDYFRLPSGKVVFDITKMAVKDLAIPLATGIQKVFKNREKLIYTNIRLTDNDKSKNITLSIYPLPEKKGYEPLVAVFLEKVSAENKDKKGDSTTVYDLNEEAQERLKDLEQDLQFTKENLQATIEELETSNEELQATNEELLASNEELQSTNEELQSTNEELYTVNAEYQNKIIELTELNNDVDNLLTSSHIGQLLLDENLEIRKFSPQSSKIFRLVDKDIGRPILHITHNLKDFDPIEAIKEVLQKNIIIEKDVETINGKWFATRIMPYHVGPETFSGVVMIFIDVTSRKKAQDSLVENERTLRAMANLAKVGSWIFDCDLRNVYCTDEVFNIYDLEKTNDKISFDRFIRFIIPEHREIVNKSFLVAEEYGKKFDHVVQINSDKSKRRWIRLIGNPETSEEGKINIFGAIQDLTEIKNIEYELEVSKNTSASLMSSVPSGLFLYRLNEYGKLVLESGNKEAENITGIDVKSWIGKEFDEIWPNAKEIGLTEKFIKVAKTGVSVEFDDLSYDDSRVTGAYRIKAFSLSNNKLVVSFEDITVKKQLEDAVQKTEEKYRKLFETMKQGVVYQNASGKIIAANPAAERILGITIDKLYGVTSHDSRWQAIDTKFNKLDGSEHPAMVSLRTGKPVYDYVMGVYHPVYNETRWLIVNAVPEFRDGEDKPYQVYATIDDVTESQNYKMELEDTKYRLDYAFKAAGFAWWDWNLTTQTVAVSDMKAEMAGFKPDEVSKSLDFWTSRIHPDDFDKTMNAMKLVLDGKKEVYEAEYRLKKKNGGWVKFSDRGEVMERDNNGKPTRLMGTVKKVD